MEPKIFIVAAVIVLLVALGVLYYTGGLNFLIGGTQTPPAQNGTVTTTTCPTVPCSTGYRCQNGACVRITTPPTTNTTNTSGPTTPTNQTQPPITSGCSGGEGTDLFNKRTITLSRRLYVDVCITGNIVKKYSCRNNSVDQSNIPCPTGYRCEDGKCIDSSTVTAGNRTVNLTTTVSCEDHSTTDLYIRGYVRNASGTYSYSCSGGIANKYRCTSVARISCPSGTCSGDVCAASSTPRPPTATTGGTCEDHGTTDQYLQGYVIENGTRVDDSCSGGVATKYRCSGTRKISTTMRCALGTCSGNVC